MQEESMVRAWGEDTAAEDRRRIVVAAIVFGHQFEERVPERPAETGEEDARRLLMDLMNRVVREFAALENIGINEAAEFLGEIGTRDRVLEFSEVLDEHARTGKPLDGLLNEAVDLRRERAFRGGRG